MEIDESKIISDQYCDENLALACLLADDVCFLNIVDVSYTNPEFYKKPEFTTCVYVLCNDTFNYASADAESITNSDGDADSEIISLYKLWKENRIYGPIKWVALKRNKRPLVQLEMLMRAQYYWDDSLETLPARPVH